MVGSFIILTIIVTLRIMAGLKLSTWSWLEKVIPYLTWGIVIMAIVFAAFTLATLIGTFARNIKKSGDRDPRR